MLLLLNVIKTFNLVHISLITKMRGFGSETKAKSSLVKIYMFVFFIDKRKLVIHSLSLSPGFWLVLL